MPDGRGATSSLSRSSSPASPDEQPAEDRIAELITENGELRARVERADQLLASATDHAVITMNLGGRITGWNTGAQAILGYAEADILGRSGELLFTPEDRADGVFVGELCQAMEAGRTVNERLHLRCDGSRFWASGTMLPLLNRGGRVVGFLNVFRDNTAVQAEEERRALLTDEVGHRLKNVLATVQAVTMLTLGTAGVSQDVQASLAGRLSALVRSHDLMIHDAADGALLAEVAERALLPYGAAERVSLSGPAIRLVSRTVEILSLTFHELATNAAKHGALSVAGGHIDVCWILHRGNDGTWIAEIKWCERGGPAVIPPTKHGFGSRLLEKGVAHDLGGMLDLDFQPLGLECCIRFPVAPTSVENLTTNDADHETTTPVA